MPKITINGKEIEFKQGQTIIQVASENGITVPHFCWHPSLSVSGNCRMCLVEVEKMPKLVIACATLAADGMVVNIDSDKAVLARDAVMEFLLINHPLDCPVCDEAGECKLQDYAYKYNKGESRYDDEKTHKDKRVPLGPFVMFDAERCISCSRCIRFCDEIAGENQLTFVKRGNRVTISTFPGKSMDNAYSLNTTDICPVGALTNRDFRFKARVWDMSKTNSICTGCARGCNDEIWVRNNIILRLTPRFNQDVNSYWMCDAGRLNTFGHVNDNRIESVIIKENGPSVKEDISDALVPVADRLKSFKSSEILFVASPYATLEDNYMLKKLASGVFHSNKITYFEHITPGSGDDKLIRDDKTPNAEGLRLLGISPVTDIDAFVRQIADGTVKAVYCLEDDIAGIDERIKSVLPELQLLITHAVNPNNTTEAAAVILPASSYAEKNGTMVNFQKRVQRIRPAVATRYMDRSLDGMSMSRLDKFGTDFDKWARKNRKDVYPGWQMISLIASHMGDKSKYDTSEDVFLEIAGAVKDFRGMDYDSIGECGQMVKS